MAFSTVDRTAYTALVDDSGSGTDGSVWDKADVNDILNAVDGLFSSSSGLSCNGALKERNRTTALGEWTNVTHAAGDYTASGSMTWTVDAGDQIGKSYTLFGKTMLLAVWIESSTTGGTASFELRVAVPGGFTCARNQTMPILLQTATGVIDIGFVQAVAGNTYVQIRKKDVSNFALVTNQLNAQFQFAFEIQ